MDYTCGSKTNAHVLLVPFPSQGHVAPFMKLGHQLASHESCRVTLFTTEFIHRRIAKFASPKLGSDKQGHVSIVSAPDGLPLEDDRTDEYKLTRSIFKVLPGYFVEFVKNASGQGNDEKITCVIADPIFGWPLEIAEKMGLQHAILFTTSPGILAMILTIPKLIESGIIDANDGTPLKNENIQLSPTLPTLTSSDFLWKGPENQFEFVPKTAFHFIRLVNQNLKFAKWILCNWFHELDPSAYTLLPKIIPVGPLLAEGQSAGNLWAEDSTSLNWLDKQSPQSVIYIAFGSTSKFTQQQFDELALSLELVGRPFLWVVRSDSTNGVSVKYPNGFNQRVAHFGKIVNWVPQEMVLTHPAIACYLTHCGWNSIMEGISMGVPMLCWPYFADQFYNRTCVCYCWKIGLELEKNENGIVTRNEINKKVNELLSDDGIRTNAQKFKELARMSVSRGGSSMENLKNFIADLRL